jgi:hypothetical protein
VQTQNNIGSLFNRHGHHAVPNAILRFTPCCRLEQKVELHLVQTGLFIFKFYRSRPDFLCFKIIIGPFKTTDRILAAYPTFLFD